MSKKPTYEELEQRVKELERTADDCRHVEKKLSQKSAYLESIFKAIPDATVFADPDRRILMANTALTKVFGYELEEVIGKYTEILYSSKESYEEQGRIRFHLSAEEKLKPYEVMYRRKDGGIFPSETVGTTVKDNEGNTIGFLGIMRDVTELREALVQVKQLKNRLQAENVYLQEEIKLNLNFEEIIGRSNAIKNVLSKVEQVAATDATALIMGETGTGKELFARAIHNLSPRNDRALVKVNCAALQQSLIESELFGHEKGSFTGAFSQRIGRSELANNGTIFLDEVGDLTLELQSKLLRVIQEGEFERLGGSRTIKVNVRVIAATHRDLEKAIKTGEFRQDLYYRLNVFPIILPPLRKRRKDIPFLTKHFVEKYSVVLGKTIDRIPQKVMDALQAYLWPGNVRELENIIERAVIMTRSSTLQIDESIVRALESGNPEATVSITLEETQRNHILNTLKETNWRIEGKLGAAERLGINASTLRSRMRKLSITKPWDSK